MALQSIFLGLVLLVNVIAGQPTLGVPAAAPGLTTTTTATAGLPAPANQNPPVSQPMLAASSGQGNWQFDFNFLGCSDGTASCSSPVWSRYSPEASPYYIAGTGSNIEVRLWWKMSGGADFDLYVEQWNGSRWVTMSLTPQRPTNWQEKIIFQGRSGYYYRFRAYRRTGASYYVLSWKYA